MVRAHPPDALGAAPVFKAVCIDKCELNCAWVGGPSNVPLGFISLTEKVMMIAMAIWIATSSTTVRGMRTGQCSWNSQLDGMLKRRTNEHIFWPHENS